MLRPCVAAGWSSILAGALASSLAVHGCVEMLDKRTLVTAPYGAYQHVAVVPAFFATIVLGMLTLLAIVRERRNAGMFGASDPLVREAMGVVRMRGPMLFGIVLALALVLLFFMESVEQFVAFGHIASGLSWLGGDLSIAAFASVASAALTTVVLLRGSRQLVAACDRVLALLDAFVRSLLPLIARVPSACAIAAPEPRSLPALLIVQCVGFRAPPRSFVAR